MKLHYTAMIDWPPLAWLAQLSPGDTVEVFHGSDVAVAPDWFCEAVWDGPYASGELDRTDVIFGSGGRRRSGPSGAGVMFVSSASTVDRLQSFSADDTTWVSNSLACLLAAIGATVDPAYAGYFEDFKSITRGISRDVRSLTTSAGDVRFTYYHNLAWDGGSLREAPKPVPPRTFPSFAHYHDFLATSLVRLADNMSSPARAFPYEPLGTISSGYDSATVAALARPCGLREAITFDRGWSRDGDTGDAIAAALGIRLTTVARDAWRVTTLPEAPFLAADAKGEDVFLKGAEAKLTRRALLTGYHGDRVWQQSAGTGKRGDPFARDDQSGLSLTEYRLWAGFVHCPVAFLGVHNLEEIGAISRSPAMGPWRTGSRYSRPICRRVLEEAGVPRDAFGQAKQASSVLFFTGEGRLSEGSRADYEAWLESHGLPSVSPRVVRLWRGTRDRSFRHLFPWALERTTQRYAEVARHVDAAYTAL